MLSELLSLCRELVLVAHLVSAHSGSGFNDRNPGLGVSCTGARMSVAAGTFRNSFERQSVYLVAGRDLIRIGPVALGGVVGLASGYDHVRKLPVIGGARMTVDWGDVEVGVLGVPPAGEYAGYLHLTLGFRLR